MQCDDPADDPARALLAEVERFLAASNMSAAQFGLQAARDRALVYELRKGREPRRATREKIAAFLEQQAGERP